MLNFFQKQIIKTASALLAKLDISAKKTENLSLLGSKFLRPQKTDPWPDEKFSH
jgi:hypothetical protein